MTVSYDRIIVKNGVRMEVAPFLTCCNFCNPDPEYPNCYMDLTDSGCEWSGIPHPGIPDPEIIIEPEI